MAVKIEYKGVEFEFDGVPSDEELEARYRAYQRKQESDEGSQPRIERRDYGDEAPVSAGQRRMWFIQRADPDNVAYHVPQAIRLTGPLDAEALRVALTRLVERHEVLRTVFPERDGRPVQKIREAPERIDWTSHDLRETPDAENRAQSIVEDQVAEPFDLGSETPLRVVFIELAEDDHVLLVLYHHIAIDEWTTGILTEELVELYEAEIGEREARLGEPTIQYADYAIWQSERLESDAYEEGADFWRGHLEGVPSGLDWPLADVSDREGHPAEHVSFDWGADLSDRVREFARESDTSVFLVNFSLFAGFLAALSGQRDLAVGVPVTMRERAELQRLVGFMLNTVPVRARYSPEQSFREFLARTAEEWEKSRAHQWIPFERVVQEVDAERRPGAPPITDVLFTYVPREQGEGELGDVEITPYDYGGRPDLLGGVPEAKSPLNVSISGEGDALTGSFEYDAARFRAEDVETMVEAFERFARACLDAPDAAMGTIVLFSADVRRRMIEDLAPGPSREFDREPVHRRFERRAGEHPERTALAYHGGEWTYGELNRRANRLANRLRAVGVEPGDAVGVGVERSPELVAALLGVLKAGAAYVALEPSLPDARLAYIFEDSAAEVAVVDESGAAALGDREYRRVGLAAFEDQSVPAGSPDVEVGPEDCIYVLYTSGTTGRPKGVMVPHGAVANHVAWLEEAYGMDASDVALLKSAYGFDMSVSELFGPLGTGGTMAIAREEGQRDPAYLVEALREFGVSCLRVVPTALNLMLAEDGVDRLGSSLRWVMLGGEALSPAVRDRFFETFDDVELHNPYGITETCVDVTQWRCRRERRGDAVSLGTPMGNYQVYVVDDVGGVRGPRVDGEMCVAGAGVTYGYRGRAARTAQAFLPNPFGDTPGERMYASGDLGTWTDRDELAYRGRVDDQLQVRGVRVELGEIEANLEAAPGVRQAAVRAVDAREARAEELIGYVVPATGAEVDDGELRSHLNERLERAVVPGRYVELEEMPRNSSGKVDRSSLPDPEEGMRPDERLEPQTFLQEQLAKIWTNVLEVDEIGIAENFFSLGGSSLDVPAVQRQIQETFGIEVSFELLARGQTVRELADVLVDKEPASDAEAKNLAAMAKMQDLTPEEARERR